MLGSRIATFRESAERTRGDQEKSVRIGDFESPFQRLSTRVLPKRLREKVSWDYPGIHEIASYYKSNIDRGIALISRHVAFMPLIFCIHQSRRTLPSVSDGWSTELMTCLFSGGHTDSQNSALTAFGPCSVSPTMGPDRNACKGNRVGLNAKSEIVNGTGSFDQT